MEGAVACLGEFIALTVTQLGVGGGKAATTLVSTSPLPSLNKLIIIASMIFGPVQALLFEFSLFVE